MGDKNISAKKVRVIIKKGEIFMPRIARKDMGTQFSHIVTQGINKEYIFNESRCKEEYKRIIRKYTEENNVSIIAYCIMDNHAHMLIYCENVKNMSRFMHCVNSSYGNYYNEIKRRVGIVFRNRYSSEPILDEKHLYNCIKYIHNNPVKAHMVNNLTEYKYSSISEYVFNKKDLIDNTGIGYEYIKNYKRGSLKDIEDDYQFIDYINSSINVKEEIEKYCKERNIYNIINNQTQLIDMVQYLLGMKITKVAIAKELNISRTTMNRLLHSAE